MLAYSVINLDPYVIDNNIVFQVKTIPLNSIYFIINVLFVNLLIKTLNGVRLDARLLFLPLPNIPIIINISNVYIIIIITIEFFKAICTLFIPGCVFWFIMSGSAFRSTADSDSDSDSDSALNLIVNSKPPYANIKINAAYKIFKILISCIE